jgi:signal transduction histidine kinase
MHVKRELSAHGALSRSVKPSVRTDRRFPERLEVTAHHVACEALTEAVKHAQASLVELPG